MSADDDFSGVLGDTWYAGELALDPLCSKWRSWIRGIEFFIQSMRYDTVVTTAASPGVKTLAVLLALEGRRKLVLLEFLPGYKDSVRASVSRRLWRWSLPRAAHRIQVMTVWEREQYSTMLGVDLERFVCIPWPLESKPGEFSAAVYGKRSGVVASGKNSCDWETLFAAASSQDWKLTVICGSKDFDKVSDLANGLRVRVLCDISSADHFSEVSKALVYAMPLRENSVSAGHIRLMTAIAAGTAIVASSVAGLEGYIDGAAVAVPCNDYLALRSAVNDLLENAEWRRSVVAAARAAAAGRSWSGYVAALRELVLS